MYILSLAAYCTSGPSKSRSSALCLCTWWHRKSLYKKCYWNRKFSILGMSAAVSACRTAARPMPCWTCSSNDCFTSGASADAIVLYICSCLCMYVCLYDCTYVSKMRKIILKTLRYQHALQLWLYWSQKTKFSIWRCSGPKREKDQRWNNDTLLPSIILHWTSTINCFWNGGREEEKRWKIKNGKTQILQNSAFLSRTRFCPFAFSRQKPRKIFIGKTGKIRRLAFQPFRWQRVCSKTVSRQFFRPRPFPF